MAVNPNLLAQAVQPQPTAFDAFVPAFQQSQDRIDTRQMAAQENETRLQEMKLKWSEYYQKHQDTQKQSEMEARRCQIAIESGGDAAAMAQAYREIGDLAAAKDAHSISHELQGVGTKNPLADCGKSELVLSESRRYVTTIHCKVREAVDGVFFLALCNRCPRSTRFLMRSQGPPTLQNTL